MHGKYETTWAGISSVCPDLRQLDFDLPHSSIVYQRVLSGDSESPVKGPSGWNLEYWDKSFICANATRCGTNATLYKTLSPLYRSVCNAYGLNVSGTEGPSWTNYKLTKVRNSSAKVAFSETSAGGLIPSWSRDPAGKWWLLGNGQLTDTDQYMAYRHRENTAANTLFFDSHVATIPYSVFMQSQFSYNLTPYQ